MNLQQTIFTEKRASPTPQWFPEVFRANLTALRENVWHLMTSAICGANSSECFVKLMPDGSWQRMWGGCSQVSMDGFSEESCVTWPKEGVMCGGTVFLPTLPVPHFGVSVSPLWRRPLASDGIAWMCACKKNPRKTIAAVWERKKQDRNLYDFMWNGLSATMAADLNGMMMGFPLHWTDLSVTETPSCRSSSSRSSGQ